MALVSNLGLRLVNYCSPISGVTGRAGALSARRRWGLAERLPRLLVRR